MNWLAKSNDSMPTPLWQFIIEQGFEQGSISNNQDLCYRIKATFEWQYLQYLKNYFYSLSKVYPLFVLSTIIKFILSA